VNRASEALKKITGRAWQLRFELTRGGPADVAEAQPAEAERAQARYHTQRTEAMRVPLVKRAHEQLGAQVVSVDDDFGAAPADSTEPSPATDAEET
jgi:hypothetical protein